MNQIHLTFTGSMAGTRLCDSQSEGRNVHAMYAPLHLADFRAQCCPDCLDTWEDDHLETYAQPQDLADPRQLPLF